MLLIGAPTRLLIIANVIIANTPEAFKQAYGQSEVKSIGGQINLGQQNKKDICSAENRGTG